MKKVNFKKGFTLIELLVVLAIIGVLASLVLIFLGPARKKGQDSSIQSHMKGLQNQIELTFVGVNYAAAFTGGNTWASSNPKIQSFLTEVDKKTTVHTAGSTAGGWAAQARLVNDTTKYFCIDTSGKGSISSTPLVAGNTVCP